MKSKHRIIFKFLYAYSQNYTFPLAVPENANLTALLPRSKYLEELNLNETEMK